MGRWTVHVMMMVVPRPVCRSPVVVRAAVRLIDIGIAIPVAVSRACRIAARQKQDERRDSKQFLHLSESSRFDILRVFNV